MFNQLDIQCNLHIYRGAKVPEQLTEITTIKLPSLNGKYLITVGLDYYSAPNSPSVSVAVKTFGLGSHEDAKTHQ